MHPPEVLQGVEGDRARIDAFARGWVHVTCLQYPSRPFVLHITPAWAAVYILTGGVVAYVERPCTPCADRGPGTPTGRCTTSASATRGA